MQWGLIGASAIAGDHLIPAIRATGGTVVAVSSRSAERADGFARTHGIPVSTGELSTLLMLPEIDAAYVSSINAHHAEQVIQAAAAGKHVLCEKPITTTLADADATLEACDRAGVVLASTTICVSDGCSR